MLVQINRLRKGRLFRLPSTGEKWKLLYCNDCRAHVQRVGGETIAIKDRKFRRQVYSDWCPETVVVIEG